VLDITQHQLLFCYCAPVVRPDEIKNQQQFLADGMLLPAIRQAVNASGNLKMKPINYYDTYNRYLDGDPSAPVHHFYSTYKFCPNCKTPLKQIWIDEELKTDFDIQRYDIDLSNLDRSVSFSALLCQMCNWFLVMRTTRDGEYKDWGYRTFKESILKQFELTSKSAPTNELANYLVKKPQDIYSIHSQKMEELVGAVFRSIMIVKLYIADKRATRELICFWF
jgi:hypothetical protein